MWNEVFLNAYYYSTLPLRRRAAIRRGVRSCEPVQILFYHRVADDCLNGWTMSTRIFERQINWLRSHFDLVGLAEAQNRIAAGRNCRPTACITFDDGYADNCNFAVPLLLRQQIPFTYFVSTNHVLRGDPFPHDVEAGQLFEANSLSDLRELASAGVEIGAHTHSHLNLGGPLSPNEIFDEVVGSKHELEAAIGCDVNYFAFPYGQLKNLSRTAFRMAYEAGFAGVCSAYGGYNFPGDDAFHLRRFHADPEFIRFKNWLTLDPRKLRMQRDFDPGEYQSGASAALEEAVAC